MTLTCKWVKHETGALLMKWTGDDDEISTMNNAGNTEAVAEFQGHSAARRPIYGDSPKSPMNRTQAMAMTGVMD